MDRRIIRLGTVLVLVAGLAACGDDDKSSTITVANTTPEAATTPATGGAAVSIADLTFSVPASVKAGDTITITNNDGFGHTFTDTGAAFNVDVPAGGSAELVVDAPGTYSVVCKIHPSMTATLLVE